MTKPHARQGEHTTYRYTVAGRETLHRQRYAPCDTVWALTTGRSGSGWLAHVLGQLEGAYALHEPGPSLFRECRDAWEGQIEVEEAVRALHVARRDLVTDAYHRLRTYVETSPFLTPLAPAIATAFEGARFLHVYRAPRPFVGSALRKEWCVYDHPRGHWWPREGYEDLAEPWQRLLRFWGRTHQAALEVEEALGPERVFRVTAESLWHGEYDGEPRRLLEWIGFPADVVSHARGKWVEAQGRPRNASDEPPTLPAAVDFRAALADDPDAKPAWDRLFCDELLAREGVTTTTPRAPTGGSRR